ncbi:ABC-2 type transport system permease protein [Caldalkalibacillus uzonensis]|uniref:ABC-2 type transport system permease protein n=1 Tax=Caldalkalibacillus uzonensis TaxID=353224 RepID=A0ABU0CSC9_9BACI|nr:ABC transporter permease [Caldalkalibacillus uzonensis]MDQ0337937.1 ABC-2 type transport system permease protein [Caldalkalibacillus uzonensis]
MSKTRVFSQNTGSTPSRPDQEQAMSLDVGKIARERIQAFITEAIRYWQLIASSGLLFTVIVLLIIGMIYYDQIVAWIPDWLPMGLIYALLFGWLVTRAPQRHFLHEADLIFLTPVQTQMDGYFRHTYRYNLILQLAAVIVAAILLYPIWRDTVALPGQPVWAYFLIPFILKGWNFGSHWALLRHVDERKVALHRGLRVLFSFGFLLWWFYQGPYGLLLLFGLVVIVFFLYERQVVHSFGYQWMRLLELEKKQKSRFYAFCQSFVDVPHMGTRVKKRPWLSDVTAWLPFQQNNAFRYLYLKTFIRAQDYLGIYVRLTAVGILFIYVLSEGWVLGVVYALFLFATATQLQAVWGHHQHQFWHQLFPLSQDLALSSFLWLLRVLLGIQAVIMWCPIMITGYPLIVTMGIALVGCLFVGWYPPRLVKHIFNKT